MILNTMTHKECIKNAKEFSKSWEGIGCEEQHSQKFWIELLSKVYGVENSTECLSFEEKVLGNSIDVLIDDSKVLIEQKSITKDLYKKQKQSDGAMLTPFEQAKRYSDNLPLFKKPKWIIVSNFK
ncbi:MAG: type IIL restriction-modification enzyme MmeI [Peptostreptococcaceae bacterium]